MKNARRVSPTRPVTECGIAVETDVRCNRKTNKNGQFCQATSGRCRFAQMPNSSKTYTLKDVRSALGNRDVAALRPSPPRASPPRPSATKRPKARSAAVCGIIPTSGQSRCSTKTSDNAEMCQTSATTGRCAFAKNPNTNRNYTLEEVRQALNARPTAVQLPPVAIPERPASPEPQGPHPATAFGDVRVFTLGVDVTIDGRLGKSGTYGDAFDATVHATDERVVLKKFTKYNKRNGIRNDALKELLLLQHLNRFPATQTVKCHGIAFNHDQTEMHIVLERLDTDLWHFVHPPSRKLTPVQIKVLFFKILCAFEAIHGLGVVHNDIKPNNIMLVKTDDDAFDVRVIDFGLSEFIGLGPTKRLSRHYRCTKFIKAPDDSHTEETYHEGLPKYFKGNRKSFASDVYSIAVSMVTLIVGTDAVRSVRRTNYNTLTVGNYTYACPDPRLEDLLLQMLHNVASARTTCEAALRHPYFTGRLDALNVHLMGGSSQFDRQVRSLVDRHESYTRGEYDDRSFEISTMEAMHRNYVGDVIPCISSATRAADMADLFRWLLDTLHVKNMAWDNRNGVVEYPVLGDTVHDLREWSDATMLFETIDVVVNGAALAARVLEARGRMSQSELRLVGLVACRIYATIFEYVPTDAITLLEKTKIIRAGTVRYYRGPDFHDERLAIVRLCNGAFPMRPVWLHLSYIWLKLEFEPLLGDYKDVFDVATLPAVKDASVSETARYYIFAIKPSRDFAVWNVAQYSVISALAAAMHVDIQLVANSPLSEHLAMTNFEELHRHYEMQRAAMGAS